MTLSNHYQALSQIQDEGYKSISSSTFVSDRRSVHPGEDRTELRLRFAYDLEISLWRGGRNTKNIKWLHIKRFAWEVCFRGRVSTQSTHKATRYRTQGLCPYPLAFWDASGGRQLFGDGNLYHQGLIFRFLIVSQGLPKGWTMKREFLDCLYEDVCLVDLQLYSEPSRTILSEVVRNLRFVRGRRF